MAKANTREALAALIEVVFNLRDEMEETDDNLVSLGEEIDKLGAQVASLTPAPRNEILDSMTKIIGINKFINGEEFYNALQEYRWAPMQDTELVSAKFEQIKNLTRNAFLEQSDDN